MIHLFRDRRTLKQIGGCKERGSTFKFTRPWWKGPGWKVICSCGKNVPHWRWKYGLHQRWSGLKAYRRQTRESLRRWLGGAG